MFVLALTLTGCDRTAHSNKAAPSITQAAKQNLRTELFFGTRKPDGSTISAEDWKRFLENEITPAFPAGLTVIEAQGQYRSQAGELQREQTRIVLLIHPDTPALENQIEHIIASYKKQFQQEAVLWTTTPVTVR